MNVHDTVDIPSRLRLLCHTLEVEVARRQLVSFVTTDASLGQDPPVPAEDLDTLAALTTADVRALAGRAWALSLGAGVSTADLVGHLLAGADHATEGIDSTIEQVASTWQWLRAAGEPPTADLRRQLQSQVQDAQWAIECPPGVATACEEPSGEPSHPDCVELLVADGGTQRLTCVRTLPSAAVHDLLDSCL